MIYADAMWGSESVGVSVSQTQLGATGAVAHSRPLVEYLPAKKQKKCQVESWR